MIKNLNEKLTKFLNEEMEDLLKEHGWKEVEQGRYSHPQHKGHTIGIGKDGVQHYDVKKHKQTFVPESELKNYLHQNVHVNKGDNNVKVAHDLLDKHGWKRYNKTSSESSYSHPNIKGHIITVTKHSVTHGGNQGQRYNRLLHSELENHLKTFHNRKGWEEI